QRFVIPAGNSVIALLPLPTFLGVVGPLITFLVLGIVVYQVAKPRPNLKLTEGPQLARVGASGEPILPPPPRPAGPRAPNPPPTPKPPEGPHLARTGPGGEPIFPPALPFCRQHGLI